MSFADQWATISVLWTRDLKRFFRKPSRLIGAFLQPVIFWVMIGSGFSSTFKLVGAEDLSYEQYFFPGVVMMLVLFAAIFGTITVIEDRREGFLQSVLIGPGSRSALVIGKSLGVSSIGLIQATIFLALAPYAGYSYTEINWFALFTFLTLGALALSTFGSSNVSSRGRDLCGGIISSRRVIRNLGSHIRTLLLLLLSSSPTD